MPGRTIWMIVISILMLMVRPAAAGPPDRVNFDGPGTVVLGAECLLFASDTGGVFVLQNAPDAMAGDYLWVTGIVEFGCISTCQQGDGCLTAKSVAPAYKGCGKLTPGPQSCTVFAGDDGQSFFVVDFAKGGSPASFGFYTDLFVTAKVVTTSCFPVVREAPGLSMITVSECEPKIFAGCGTIQDGIGSCPFSIFVSDELFNGKPKLFALANMGDFGVGDHVYVKGTEDIGCYDGAPFFCEADCLLDNIIVPCGEPFVTCGQLVFEQFCGILFQADGGGLFKLSDLGGFLPGDHVLVKGAINLADCGGTVECLFACVDVNTIELCDTSKTFSGCGEIVLFFECGFGLVTDEGQSFLLSSIGGFNIGDKVFATGTINPDCEQGFPIFCDGIPCLENAVLEPCGEPFAGCGQIVQLIECGFALQTDESLFLLSSIEPFSVGDTVFAEGTIIPDCDQGFPLFCDGIPCLDGATLSPCGNTFEGCGTLQIGPQGCTIFVPGDNDVAYVLQNYGNFGPGDNVFVKGPINDDVIGCFPVAIPLIENDDIQACLPTSFSGCGVLQIGPQSCTLFVADEDGKAYLLDEQGPFSIGDHVFVTGDVELVEHSCFPLTYPVIHNESITLCETTFVGCGTLKAATFCGAVLAADTGGFYQLDQIGAFAIGDHVFVKGTINPFCNVIPECSVGSCIEVGTIEACGDNWFSGCGELVLSFTCGLTLNAYDGSGLYILQGDLPELDPGTPVFVEGPILEPGCGDTFGICPCIEIVSATKCIVPGDLNGDGMVDGADLGLLLSAWGPCPIFQITCLGDIDCDGDVDGGDLGLLLAAWTATN